MKKCKCDYPYVIRILDDIINQRRLLHCIKHGFYFESKANSKTINWNLIKKYGQKINQVQTKEWIKRKLIQLKKGSNNYKQ